MQADETPTKPVTPLALTSNGYRRAATGSDEEAALIRAGYSLVEHDGTVSLLRRARRSTDIVTATIHYRAIERGVLDRMAAELEEIGWRDMAGNPPTGLWIRALMDRFWNDVRRETGSAKTAITGRLHP